ELNILCCGVVALPRRQLARHHADIDYSVQQRSNSVPGATASYDDIRLWIPGHEFLGASGHDGPHGFRTGDLHRARLERRAVRPVPEVREIEEADKGGQADGRRVQSQTSHAISPEAAGGLHARISQARMPWSCVATTASCARSDRGDQQIDMIGQ